MTAQPVRRHHSKIEKIGYSAELGKLVEHVEHVPVVMHVIVGIQVGSQKIIDPRPNITIESGMIETAGADKIIDISLPGQYLKETTAGLLKRKRRGKYCSKPTNGFAAVREAKRYTFGTGIDDAIDKR